MKTLVKSSARDSTLKNLIVVAIVSAIVSGVLSIAGNVIMSGRIENLHVEINHRMTELLDASKAKSYGEGEAAGKTSERGEHRKDLRSERGRAGKAGVPGPTGPTGPTPPQSLKQKIFGYFEPPHLAMEDY